MFFFIVLAPGFPFCRGEAGLVVTPLYGYVCIFLPPLPFSDLPQSSHLRCGLPFFLQYFSPIQIITTKGLSFELA